MILTQQQIKEMSHNDIANLVQHDLEGAQAYRAELIDQLSAILWDIGRIWDKLEGIDAKSFSGRYGSTGNKKSMTYKLRKVAGYSYP